MPRKFNTRDQVPNYLIICEGKKTEPQYFKGFHIGRVLTVEAVGLGKSAVNLVQETIKLKTNGTYEQVWVVFDIDDCTISQINDAIRLAEENNIRVAYSNQAFELWYLLHFAFHNTGIDRKQYIHKLSSYLGIEYEKNAPDLYVRLLRQQKTAIQNARRLFTSYDHPDPCRNDPCTTVFLLVEEFSRYSRDSRRKS